MKLGWNDTDEIAWALAERYPQADPLRLSFPRLHQLIIGLPDFEDNPGRSTEGMLERIQMTWYEERKG